MNKKNYLDKMLKIMRRYKRYEVACITKLKNFHELIQL